MASKEELGEVRKQKLEILKKNGMDPFTASCNRTHTLIKVKNEFDNLAESGSIVILAGRIMAIRGQGAIMFVSFFDGTGNFQAVLKKGELDDNHLKLFSDAIDLADFIEFKGKLFTTERGQQSIMVSEWRILTKALLPLPDKWHGLTDDDERYRKRYLDILMNPNLRELFEKKSEFWKSTREFLLEHNFIEVETPTLELTTGGAEARPFATRHNDYDLDVYMRISVGELWQKRLMAAGLPRTFEIGRVYRNEGSSPNHLQEFTNIEFYCAYMEYREGMKFTEKMMKYIIQNTFKTLQFSTRGFDLDLSQENWPTIEYVPYIEEKTGINVLSATLDEMKDKLKELNVSYEGTNRERLMDTLWKYCRKQIAGPVWLIHHPKLVSPLSKALPENPEFTERCQLILAGTEANNGFSELNDPIDQAERFEIQKDLIASGDEEAMMPDFEFVEMLEHGMPPTFGFGMGERLFSLLCDKPIRETTLFPLVKPRQ